MSAKTGIEWTDATWNPVRGCSRVSEGCRNCYAERIAARFSGIPGMAFHGFAVMTESGPRWTGKAALNEDTLSIPLRWKKPRRIFVNSMSDLFHEALPDAKIQLIFQIMMEAPRSACAICSADRTGGRG
jgi:protein gp37